MISKYILIALLWAGNISYSMSSSQEDEKLQKVIAKIHSLPSAVISMRSIQRLMPFASEDGFSLLAIYGVVGDSDYVGYLKQEGTSQFLILYLPNQIECFILLHENSPLVLKLSEDEAEKIFQETHHYHLIDLALDSEETYSTDSFNKDFLAKKELIDTLQDQSQEMGVEKKSVATQTDTMQSESKEEAKTLTASTSLSSGSSNNNI
jgi:hypothetical protein